MPQTVNIAYVAPDKATARQAFVNHNNQYATPLPANVLNALDTLLQTLADVPGLPGYGIAVWGHSTHFQITMKRLPADESVLAPLPPIPPTIVPTP